MTLRIHNSLTRDKEDFIPLNPPRVLFYNCGPTVYGEFHIGNARNFVVFDVIRRWLLARGYDVQYVQNITDVDDKIINRANLEGVSPHAIAEKYTRYFLGKLEQLGNLPATAHPKATDHIPGMIAMISRLIERGHAYPSDDGSVWYEVGTFREYGKLSRMPLDQMQQGERVDAEQQRRKRSPLDFALWKASKPGEPAWDSPWGTGRPGWHIECSCMSMTTLGTETLDIHAGGSDLRFPHHENEIAQSEGATGKPFARYWIHNGMLDIEGEKMSKSLGNVKSIDDMLALVDALTLRYFLISARYRDKLDMTEDNINKCRSAVDRMTQACREARETLEAVTRDLAWVRDPELKALDEEFGEAMDDDFNTPRALGALAKSVNLLNTIRLDVARGEGPQRLARCLAMVEHLRDVLGLGDKLQKAQDDFEPALLDRLKALYTELIPETAQQIGHRPPAQMIDDLIVARAAARKNKDFARGDAIRNKLGALGILLEDKPGKTIWRRG